MGPLPLRPGGLKGKEGERKRLKGLKVTVNRDYELQLSERQAARERERERRGGARGTSE